MTLQTLPVMGRLHLGSRWITREASTGNPVVKRLNQSDIEELARYKRVKLDDGQRIPHPGNKENPISMFGHLRLPFPRTWIEWTDFSAPRISNPVKAAACVQSDANTWQMTLHGPGRNGEVWQRRESLIVHLNDDGTVQGISSEMPWGDQLEGGLVTEMTETVGLESEGHFRRGMAIGSSFDALVAIGWMNCKNVQMHEHHELSFAPTLPKPTRGKMRKKTSRVIDFHTIQLPGSSPSSGRGALADGRSVRLHQVRGHFKTYTADAPLLGRSVGTYWWGWQVRGSKENGVSITDYRLEAAL